MAAPQRFTISVDFSDEETAGVDGRSTVRTAMLDALFAALKTTTDGICDSIVLMQRDDGRLREGVVKSHTLQPAFLTYISKTSPGDLRGAWASGVEYALKDVVTSGTGSYACLIAHTSTAFATDRAAGRWGPINESGAYIAGSFTVTQAGGIEATNAQAALAEVDAKTLKNWANLEGLADVRKAREHLAIEQCTAIAVGDETTALAAGVSKVTLRAPFDFKLNSVRASLSTAGTTPTTVDIHRNGVSIFGTKLVIDANDKTSSTSSVTPTLITSDVADDDELTIDIDVAGAGAKGLKVYLLHRYTLPLPPPAPTPLPPPAPTPAPTPALQIAATDILTHASAMRPFNQQHSTYQVQVVGTARDVSVVPEAGIHGAALPNGETLRFGKVPDPTNPARKALHFLEHKDDPPTSAAQRIEIRAPNYIEHNRVYWIGLSIYVYDWGTLPAADQSLFGVQMHQGNNNFQVGGPSFSFYTTQNGRFFRVQTQWSTSATPREENAVNIKHTEYPMPFGRWADLVVKFRLNTSGSAFLQAWMDGNLIANHSGYLGYNTPGYKDYAKFGYYNWNGDVMNATARKLLLRSPVIVSDLTNKYSQEILRAFVNKE